MASASSTFWKVLCSRVSGGLLPPDALTSCPPSVPRLIPSPVRPEGSEEGLQVALNPLRSKLPAALGARREDWKERLNLVKR